MLYDLAEISLYISWFRSGHDDTADAAEAWQNRQYFLLAVSTSLGPGVTAR
jgi:hypothetical protein